MFKNRLANYERYSKDINAQFDLEKSTSVYEVFIELSHDKEGNAVKNRDGSDRYYAIDDNQLVKLDHDVLVKKIRDNYFKTVFEVNGDHVEKVERDNKRIYYVVDPEKITTLTAGTTVVASKNNDTYRIPNEVGYVLVDDTDIDNPRIMAVRKFKTDDHKAEAEEIVRGGGRHNQEQN